MNDNAIILERQFIDQVEGFEAIDQALDQGEQRLQAWRAALMKDLRAAAAAEPDEAGSVHEVDLQAQAVRKTIGDRVKAWAERWSSVEAARRDVEQHFGDRLIVLVFGKFNAGKSSFCNFLGQRFTLAGRIRSAFVIRGGQVEPIAGDLAEGVTETTAAIQGVQLGPRMVLLDTPGLHSETQENAGLTRRYLDAADTMVWLTSSTAPGQVAELDDMAAELRAGKPLLPVITKSDVYEEDETDDGRLIQTLRNKTPDNRALQEGDVRQRALDKLTSLGLDGASLRPPLSLSVQCAKTDGDLDAAGFGRLYADWCQVAQQAMDYKRHKALNVLRSHIEGHVARELRDQLLPKVTELLSVVESGRTRLVGAQSAAANEVTAGVLAALPNLLERHSGNRDRLLGDLEAHIHDRLRQVLDRELEQVQVSIDRGLAALRLPADADYETRHITSAAPPASDDSNAAWIAGATLGAKIGSKAGPLGAAAGAVVGGMLGKLFGKGSRRAQEQPAEVVQVSYTRFHQALSAELPQLIGRQVQDALAPALRQLEGIEVQAQQLRKVLEAHLQKLQTLCEELDASADNDASAPKAGGAKGKQRTAARLA